MNKPLTQKEVEELLSIEDPIDAQIANTIARKSFNLLWGLTVGCLLYVAVVLVFMILCVVIAGQT